MLPKVLTRLTNKTPAAPAAVNHASKPTASGSVGPVATGATRADAGGTSAIGHSAVVQPIGNILTEPSIHEEVEAGSDVRRSLRTSLEKLEASLDPVERRGDALAFFERISKSGEKTVRQPPAAAQRALDLLRRDVAISDLVKLVEQDPVLAQSLLRFANSAANSTGARSTSLAESIRRVGTQGLRSVILSSMVEGTLCRTGSQYDSMVRQVWEHMVRTAPIARVLAPAFGVVPDEAFTLALLHDVGKLVLFDRLGTLRAELRREVKLTPQLMPRLLGELHEVLGGAAALRWGLGRAAVAVVSSHHRRSDPLEPSLAAECVFIAERLDLAMARGESANLVRWFDEGRLQASYDAVAPLVERIMAPDSGGTGFHF
ncbi:MAG: HDOD domain-containing protein [Gemmatimonadaceae bacterium]|nr:HDOD domain-containing protein [Gemmatimonadaceae bacterium]